MGLLGNGATDFLTPFPNLINSPCRNQENPDCFMCPFGHIRPKLSEETKGMPTWVSTLLEKKILLAAIGLVTLSVSLAGAEPPKDVEGWRQARWGMTESQILEAFKGEAIRLDKVDKSPGDNLYASVGIINFNISGKLFYVRFLMDDYNKVLKRIYITYKKASIIDFNNLKTMLIDKYGQPQSVDKDKDSYGNIYGATWIFATTIIELRLAEITGHNYINLVYRAKDKGDSDKL